MYFQGPKGAQGRSGRIGANGKKVYCIKLYLLVGFSILIADFFSISLAQEQEVSATNLWNDCVIVTVV